MAGGLTLTFTIQGEKQLSRTLLLMADRVRDWTPAFEETAVTLKDVFSNDVFDTEGAAIEEHWQALNPKYAAQKNRKYPGKRILEATGDMRAGFTSLVRPDMAAVWNRVEYFKYHQSNQPRSRMPRRVMIKLANAQKEMVVKIFHTYFQAVVANRAANYL